MASKVGIVNMALGHLAVSKAIASITEKSEEARAANLYYDTALEMVLRDAPWPFATKIASLALVEEDPTDEWGYSYRYPTDCLRIKRILSGVRNDTRQSRVSYKILSDSQGRLVYTDEENAEMEYIATAEDPQFYPPDFTLAFSFLLASLMAKRLTGGDQFKLGADARADYGAMIAVAQSNANNEEQNDEEPDSEFIRERE